MREHIRLVGGVILNDDQKMLLLHQQSPAQWEMPSGEVNFREDSEQALRRHVPETLGVSVERARWLGQAVFSKEGHVYECEWFTAQLEATPHVKQPTIFDELHYFPLYGLRRMSAVLSPHMLAFVKQLNDGEISPSQ